jgi:hypothetical protein
MDPRQATLFVAALKKTGDGLVTLFSEKIFPMNCGKNRPFFFEKQPWQ